MTRINVWDYQQEYAALRDEILDAVDRVFKSGRLILGAEVTAFEAALAGSVSSSAMGVGVNSGTDALFIALKALGVGPGDEVITVSNTAVPTVSAIVSAGARPVFVDIDPDTYLMDTRKVEQAITDATRCLLPVHLYGQCVDMGELGRIAKKHGLAVLEDCAQSTGAVQNGRVAGGMGDLGAFSFYPTKVLGGYGDGGMIVGQDPAQVALIRSLRMYGMEGTYYAKRHGYNSRLDEVQAAILHLKLKRLDAEIARRRELAARYSEALMECGLTLPVVASGNEHVFYLYVVRHPQRDAIMAALAETDIHLNISYPYPIHTMDAYLDFAPSSGVLENTERLAQEIFSLPMYPTLSNDDQDRVIESIRKALTRV